MKDSRSKELSNAAVDLEASVFTPWGQSNDILLSQELASLVQKTAHNHQSPRDLRVINEQRQPPRPTYVAKRNYRKQGEAMIPKGAFISLQSRNMMSKGGADYRSNLKRSFYNLPTLHPQTTEGEHEQHVQSLSSPEMGSAERKKMLVFPPLLKSNDGENSLKTTEA